MTLPRTVAQVLSDHVTFELESIDRMLLHVYQPRLQYAPGVSNFFVKHRGYKFAGSVLMKQITDGFLVRLHQWISAHDVELVHFRKGERKDEIAQQEVVPGFVEVEVAVPA